MYLDWRWVVAAIAFGGCVRFGEWLLKRLDQRAADRARLAAESTAEWVRMVRRLEGIVDLQKRELDQHEANCTRNRRKLEDIGAKVQEMQVQITALRKENADLRSDLGGMQGQLQAREGELARLRAESRR